MRISRGLFGTAVVLSALAAGCSSAGAPARNAVRPPESTSRPVPAPHVELPSPDDSGPAPIGFASNLMWQEHGDPGAELDQLASLGIRAIREDILWDVVEPRRGEYSWDRADALFLAAAERHVGVLAIAGYDTSWASSAPRGADPTHYPPRDAADYAAYVAAMARRYGTHGSLWERPGAPAFRPLLGIELWNEASQSWSWRPDPDPAGYAALARAAATAIHAAAPDARVVLTADPFDVRRDGTRTPWLERVLDAAPDLGSMVDVYAVHPYPEPRNLGPLAAAADHSRAFARVADVDAIARAHGVPHPVWITEIGWSTAPVAGGVNEFSQALYLTQAIDQARAWPFVRRVFVYTWAADPRQGGGIEAAFGMRRADGSAKPVLRSVVALAGQR